MRPGVFVFSFVGFHARATWATDPGSCTAIDPEFRNPFAGGREPLPPTTHHPPPTTHYPLPYRPRLVRSLGSSFDLGSRSGLPPANRRVPSAEARTCAVAEACKASNSCFSSSDLTQRGSRTLDAAAIRLFCLICTWNISAILLGGVQVWSSAQWLLGTATMLLIYVPSKHVYCGDGRIDGATGLARCLVQAMPLQDLPQATWHLGQPRSRPAVLLGRPR